MLSTHLLLPKFSNFSSSLRQIPKWLKQRRCSPPPLPLLRHTLQHLRVAPFHPSADGSASLLLFRPLSGPFSLYRSSAPHCRPNCRPPPRVTRHNRTELKRRRRTSLAVGGCCERSVDGKGILISRRSDQFGAVGMEMARKVIDVCREVITV